MDMNHDQVRGILQYIDLTQPEPVKQDIFNQLGHECFRTRNVYEWVSAYQQDVQAFLDRVNIEDASPYWERFTFNDDRSVLYLTGKKVSGCVCAFGEGENPPEALCAYCCKTFQERIFQTLFQRPVRVEITESLIFGGERCSTAIHLLDNDA